MKTYIQFIRRPLLEDLTLDSRAISLDDAIEKDAATLVDLMIKNDLTETKDALSKHVIGPVGINVTKTAANAWTAEHILTDSRSVKRIVAITYVTV